MDFDLGQLAGRVWKSWVDGGWTMIPIAAVAVLLYGSAFQVLLELRRRFPRRVEETKLREWVSNPDGAPGELGEVIRYTQDDVNSLDEVARRFAEVELTRVPEVDRRLSQINVLVGAAPLLGLLGTVLGMLVTFRAIAAGGGRMVDAMAQGISEALITTEMGLLVALPGMMLVYLIRRRRNEYVSTLAQLESITLRYLRPRLHGMTRAFVRRRPKTASPAPTGAPTSSQAVDHATASAPLSALGDGQPNPQPS